MDRKEVEELKMASLRAFLDVSSGRTEVSHFKMKLLGHMSPSELKIIGGNRMTVGAFFCEEVWDVIVKPALKRFMLKEGGK